GVYAVWTVMEGHLRQGAIANIGIRPSFDAGARLLEVHIFDYEGDLYGKRLRVEFVKRLRPERRFEAVEALIAQVRQDIEEARCILQAAVAREGR
ncbi:MAG: riboflavin kinase, partial [Chloroflexi bacterium]|nr:riboflavin kinase [Chloroflexota bacterium]